MGVLSGQDYLRHVWGCSTLSICSTDLMSLEERILALERKLLDPDVRASSQELDRLIADDFVEFGSSGRIWNKRDVLSALPTESGVHFTISNFAIRELGPGLVLATYRVIRSTKEAEHRASLRSSIWRFENERWQMTFHQGTPAD